MAIQWDNKFGKLQHEFDDIKERKAIEGVGKDAEIVTNAQGGKQAKSPMSLHLVDPVFLNRLARDESEKLEYPEGQGAEDIERYNCLKSIIQITEFMFSDNKFALNMAMDYLEEDAITQLIKIAKVLQEGAEKYAPNNWRLIPQEEHINHALIHIIAHLMGDTQDNHKDHALARLMMAYATEKSDNFDYLKYVVDYSDIEDNSFLLK